jgi:hypothetical protein
MELNAYHLMCMIHIIKDGNALPRMIGRSGSQPADATCARPPRND